MIVTLDTNIYISILLGSQGAPAEILYLWKEKRFSVAMSVLILEEIVGVALSAKLRSSIQSHALLALVHLLEVEAVWVGGGEKRNDLALIDRDDGKVVSCAVDSSSSYLITGNLKHLQPADGYKGIQVVGPRDFVDIVANSR